MVWWRGRKRMVPAVVLGVLLLAAGVGMAGGAPGRPETGKLVRVLLPPPRLDGPVSLEKALAGRRTRRDLPGGEMLLAELGQLLWAAQGRTGPDGFRTAPSAGALFPLEVFVVTGRVAGVAPGIYRYDPSGHALERRGSADPRPELASAAIDQPWVGQGSVLIVLTGVTERTAAKYGERAFRYVCLEAGHAAQNILLEAAALGLPTGLVGAFEDERVLSLLDLGSEHRPLYLIPVGKK